MYLRVCKTDVEKLANDLCVEQSNINRVIQQISAEKIWTVFDDLILTQDFVKKIERDLESQILESGSTSIIAQTQRMKLPYSLLKSILDNKANVNDDYIRYPQVPDVVSTKSYIDDCKNMILNALKLYEEPYPMFKLQKSQDIQEDMFYVLLEQIIKDESFDLGLLRGNRSRAIFEPSSYKARQLSLIRSIFDSNDCISFSTIENLYTFASPADLIADSYDKDSFLQLNSCFLKSRVKNATKERLENISNYCDVNDILPAILTFEDVNMVVDIILSEIRNKNNSGGIKLTDLDGGYVVRAEYVQHLVSGSNNYLRNLSRTLKQKLGKNFSSSNIGLGDNDIIKAFESLDCPRNIAERLLPISRNSMVAQFSEVVQTPFIETEAIVSGDEWIIQQKTRELEKLESLRQSIYFNDQAKKLFQDAAARKSLEKYILRNQCTEFLYHLVIYLILDQSYNKKEVSQSTSLCIRLEDIENQSIIDLKQQKCVIAYFIRENDHRYDNTSVVEIEKLLKDKKLDEFITLFLIQDKQGLFSHQTSLNSDQLKKTANDMTKKQLFQQLQQLAVSEQTAPQMLHLISLLIFQKVFNIPLYVTGRFVPVILNEIRPSLSQEEKELFDMVHLSIIDDQRKDHLEDYTKLKSLGIKLQQQQQYRIMEKLPAEVILLVSTHLPFKTYIQYSQTCRATHQLLISSSVICYLNNRFKFGHGNQTGALLLFIFHNILKIPEKIRDTVLEHFITEYEKDTSFIRGWSIIHAIMYANPGSFQGLLIKDSNNDKKPATAPMIPLNETKRNFLFYQQRSFAKKIFSRIIASTVPHKHKLRSSKTYQTIFKSLLYTGDLSTIQLCLQIVGPPRDTITLSETDYNEKFPIVDDAGGINFKRKRDLLETEYYDNQNPIQVICRDDLYLNFKPAQMRLLARQLLQKHQTKVTFYPPSYNSRPTRPRYDNDTSTTRKHIRRRLL
ncbi:hypothetical protein [Parasitella parasitica]|uniref:F-box domain-containing protein n=1 Tax=Parasitella parasitica TaxID=35722 RepID=A0A0B7NG12_9FUNG|nr:hypothetical protein [Parasitella parasitica]